MRWRRSGGEHSWIGEEVHLESERAESDTAGDRTRLHDLRHLLTRAELEFELGGGPDLRRTLRSARELCEPLCSQPSSGGVDLCVVLEEEVQAVRRTFPDRAVGLSVELGCRARGPQVPLRRVLANLLANGARATPPGGRLDASARRSGAGACSVLVRDSGAGIPATAIDRLLGTRSSASGGSGLGSLSVAEAASQLRATILVRSTEGLGTEFEVLLPA